MLYEAIDDALEIPPRAFIRTDEHVVTRLLAQLGLGDCFGSRRTKRDRLVEVPNHPSHWLYFARFAEGRPIAFLHLFMALPKACLTREKALEMCSAFLRDAGKFARPGTFSARLIPEVLLARRCEKAHMPAHATESWPATTVAM
jgi:hypothetical protein